MIALLCGTCRWDEGRAAAALERSVAPVPKRTGAAENRYRVKLAGALREEPLLPTADTVAW